MHADDAEDAAGDDREAQRRERREHAGLDVAEGGRARDLRELDALQPAEQMVGRRANQHRAAQHRAEEVGGAGDREQHERGPERRREAEGRDRDAPRARRDRDAEALPPHVRRPARDERAEQRAGVRRRVEVADGRRVAAEPVQRDRREERRRHAEDHRVVSTREDPEQRLAALQEAEARRGSRTGSAGRRFRPAPSAAAARSRRSDAAKVTRSMPYVQGTPATAIRIPPTAGPPTAASEL